MEGANAKVAGVECGCGSKEHRIELTGDVWIEAPDDL
jgi:hypothetical protein